MEDVTREKGLGDAVRRKQAQLMSKAGASSAVYSWLAKETFARFFLFFIFISCAFMLRLHEHLCETVSSPWTY